MTKLVDIPAAQDADGAAVQLAILAELRGIRRDLARIIAPPRPKLDRAAHAKAAALLPAIVRYIGQERCFSAAELRAFAESKLVGASEMREQLEAAVDKLDKGAGRRLGKLLASCEGADVDGLCLRSLGSDEQGRIWSVGAT